MIQVTAMMCQTCDRWVPFWNGEKKTCTCKTPTLGRYEVGKATQPKEIFPAAQVKKLDRSKDWSIQSIPMQYRYERIMEVLNENRGVPLSPSAICEKYIIGKITASDPLSTGTILHVLSMAGVVKRHENFVGKSIRVSYELA